MSVNSKLDVLHYRNNYVSVQDELVAMRMTESNKGGCLIKNRLSATLTCTRVPRAMALEASWMRSAACKPKM